MKKRQYIFSASFALVGLVMIVAFLAIFLFRSNMVLPKQPELTDTEIEYFKILEIECNCNVMREVDPRALRHNDSDYEHGWYMLICSADSCNGMYNIDSLSAVAERIAKNLHVTILGDKFKYEYREITVGFVCNTGSVKDQYFDYKPSELHK